MEQTGAELVSRQPSVFRFNISTSYMEMDETANLVVSLSLHGAAELMRKQRLTARFSLNSILGLHPTALDDLALTARIDKPAPGSLPNSHPFGCVVGHSESYSLDCPYVEVRLQGKADVSNHVKFIQAPGERRCQLISFLMLLSWGSLDRLND
jgi:hypothetical protein